MPMRACAGRKTKRRLRATAGCLRAGWRATKSTDQRAFCARVVAQRLLASASAMPGRSLSAASRTSTCRQHASHPSHPSRSGTADGVRRPDHPGGRLMTESNRSAIRRKAALGHCFGGLVFLLASGAAPAQVATAEPEDGIEEVLVTGSRIVRSDATAPSPITVVGAEQLQKAGTLSITETLRQDPSIGSQSAGPTLTMRNAGRHSVDLRNLGGSRTLTLVNGKRLPLYSDVLGNSGQDISAVPSAMIGRIEILRDGASTAYGADAVAGVVNIILDDDFDGAQLEAYSGISTHGDGDAYRLSGKI